MCHLILIFATGNTFGHCKISNNNTRTMFMVLPSWPKPLREFTWFICWVQTQHQVAANPQTKPTDLGRESTSMLLPSTSPSPFIIIICLKADTYFTVPRRVEGWVDMGTAVYVCSPCQSLYITLAVDHCDRDTTGIQWIIYAYIVHYVVLRRLI